MDYSSKCKKTCSNGAQCTRDRETGKEYCWQHKKPSKSSGRKSALPVDMLTEIAKYSDLETAGRMSQLSKAARSKNLPTLNLKHNPTSTPGYKYIRKNLILEDELDINVMNQHIPVRHLLKNMIFSAETRIVLLVPRGFTLDEKDNFIFNRKNQIKLDIYASNKKYVSTYDVLNTISQNFIDFSRPYDTIYPDRSRADPDNRYYLVFISSVIEHLEKNIYQISEYTSN